MTRRRAASGRSTDPTDYQRVPRPVAAMAKHFPDRHEIAAHEHERDQLVFAVEGVMRVTTDSQAWIVPPDRAVYIPGGIVHRIGMRGAVAMRTLYIANGVARGLPTAPTVMIVSGLLRELILALLSEPVRYAKKGRGGFLAELIFDEIRRAERQALVIPLPRDSRLKKLCAALLENPASRNTLEDWSASVGASPRTLARAFERELGMAFSAWRRRLRFHNAMEAIVRGDPVGAVAMRNGYRSISAFSASFRKTMGVSPMGVRRPSA